MDSDTAQILGMQALSWIATQDDMFSALLTATGASPRDLRTRADDPQFLSDVLDFLMQKDWWAMDFAAQNDLPYNSVVTARVALEPAAIPVLA